VRGRPSWPAPGWARARYARPARSPRIRPSVRPPAVCRSARIGPTPRPPVRVSLCLPCVQFTISAPLHRRCLPLRRIASYRLAWDGARAVAGGRGAKRGLVAGEDLGDERGEDVGGAAVVTTAAHH